MAEYIDREKLIEGRVSNDPVVIAAKCAPAEDVAPVRHGKWEANGIAFRCSICKQSFVIEQSDDGEICYCIFCGAKMDGKE